MRRSEAARYARWAALVAVLLAAAVAGVYAYRAWQAAETRRKAPPAVPPAVQKRSAGFSFSKVEQDRTLFTVRALQTTQFKAGDMSLLQDVWITIYGRQGKRFDNIHTRECDYAPTTGRITCTGEVQLELESAEEARQRSGQRVIRVATANVSFDRETGEARTAQPVTFRFPYGSGRAIGLTYSTREAIVRLDRDVEMTLQPTAASKAGPARRSSSANVGGPILLTGGSLEYHRNDRTLRLLAPVRVKQGNRELSAGALALEFDAEMRASRAVATQAPQLRSIEPRGQANLSAEEFVAVFRPDGFAERILAQGKVNGSRTSQAAHLPGAGDYLQAQRLEAEMESGSNQPKLITASGDVRLLSERRASPPARANRTRVEAEALRLLFVPAGGRSGERRIDRAETLGQATVEWLLLPEGLVPSRAEGKAAEETTRVRGQRLVLEYGERNWPSRLIGNAGVEIERRFGNHPAQTTTSRELALKLGPGGEWTEAEQAGEVRFREADRTAQAQTAKLLRAADTLRLAGSAVVSDAEARTAAETISMNQRTGEIRAEGSVRTSYWAPQRNGLTDLAPQPAHISSEKLLANRITGRALYSSNVRLWQGATVIEADAIELLRDDRQLKARGDVRALFPQAAAAGSVRLRSPQAAGGASEPTVWSVRSARLTYWSTEGMARMEENVTAQSRLGEIHSRVLDLFLSSAQDAGRQFTRAVATGGVTLRQGERRGTAERAEYTVAEGKFVLSGGHPTLYDAAWGTTTGRQLTFFLADDKILVDSEEGSRTLTRHRVEK